MDKKVKEALGSASYLTYHWSQYTFEQLIKEMARVCGLCNKALGIPKITALQTSSEASGRSFRTLLAMSKIIAWQQNFAEKLVSVTRR